MMIKPWKYLGWTVWKLQASKGPVGRIYRYFWRKKVMKRIIEVANEINQRSMRGQHDFSYIFPETTSKSGMDILTPVGYVPSGPAESPVINPAQLARGLVAPSIGITVMDPTKIYNILPKQMIPELPHIRRRICRLRKRKQWKSHTYHH